VRATVAGCAILVLQPGVDPSEHIAQLAAAWSNG
jgi:hypothetical protein